MLKLWKKALTYWTKNTPVEELEKSLTPVVEVTVAPYILYLNLLENNFDENIAC